MSESVIATTGRTCGTCTMCCKLPALEGMKPAGQWCTFCSPRRGCLIYVDRPKPCREFECLWKIDPRVPEELKPNKSKIIMAIFKEGVLVVYVDKAYPTAWKEGEAGKWLACWPEPFVLETGSGKLVVRNTQDGSEVWARGDDGPKRVEIV